MPTERAFTDREVMELFERIARMEEKLDSIRAMMEEHRVGEVDRLRDAAEEKVRLLADASVAHENLHARISDVRSEIGVRVNKLELWRAKVTGIALVIGAGSGVVSGVATALLLRAMGT